MYLFLFLPYHVKNSTYHTMWWTGATIPCDEQDLPFHVMNRTFHTLDEQDLPNHVMNRTYHTMWWTGLTMWWTRLTIPCDEQDFPYHVMNRTYHTLDEQDLQYHVMNRTSWEFENVHALVFVPLCYLSLGPVVSTRQPKMWEIQVRISRVQHQSAQDPLYW